MKKILICPVVINTSIDKVLDMIPCVEKEGDIIEVRIDYLSRCSEDDLRRIKRRLKKDAIITCRRKDEGGHWNGSEKNRLVCLQTAFDLGFSHVDVELKTLEEGQFRLPPISNTQTIVSFHDFNETPPLDNLKEIIFRMKKYGQSIMKIATMIKKSEDVQSLYKLLIEKEKGDKYIIIGMGKKGLETRVVSPLLGGYITYCSLEGNGSAPGQMSCKKMNIIYSLLE